MCRLQGRARGAGHRIETRQIKNGFEERGWERFFIRRTLNSLENGLETQLKMLLVVVAVHQSRRIWCCC
jgi:hypothetical protein